MQIVENQIFGTTAFIYLFWKTPVGMGFVDFQLKVKLQRPLQAADGIVRVKKYYTSSNSFYNTDKLGSS